VNQLQHSHTALLSKSQFSLQSRARLLDAGHAFLQDDSFDSADCHVDLENTAASGTSKLACGLRTMLP